MKWLARKLTSRFNKDQAGQSIVLLAFALIGLIAFTGLVTDISILFVRFSNLRRTIDSSAIAAAGQIREGTDYESVALAARQFIQLHGLEPHRVWVETCETDIANWRAGTGAWEGQPHPETPGEDISDEMGNTELCNWEAPRKLVRVTAQIESETYFLRLLGINSITLEASSVSETAVLDVALVLDTSYSMSRDTDFVDYTNPADNLSHRGASMPYVVGGASPGSSGIREACAKATTLHGQTSAQKRYLSWAPCCNDPGSGKVFQDANGNWIIYSEAGGGTGYQAGLDVIGNNNNTADYDYSDLVCNPFRQVKDAARNFVQRLDFVRGDRVTFVAFDRVGRNILPDGVTEAANIMITDEEQALNTLDKYVGVNVSQAATHPPTYQGEFRGDCVENNGPQADYADDQIINNSQTVAPFNPNLDRWRAYESIAPCPDTNMGGGIEAGNNALTNAATIRRDAVWVMIVLSDGAATATNPIGEFADPNDHSYGYAGFCPWSTFCNPPSGNPLHKSDLPVHSECSTPPLLDPTHGFYPPNIPFCNDNKPNTRHFCLQWSVNADLNGLPDLTNPDCGETGRYDADDYGRDWADFAGLVDVADGVPGNFIAIFTIGFGSEIATDNTGAPLLRYIADAGDNGFIDNDLQQDYRDDHVLNGSVSPDVLGEPDDCEGVVSNTQQCGQYYYASNLSELDVVFEAIASRLFTRLSR